MCPIVQSSKTTSVGFLSSAGAMRSLNVADLIFYNILIDGFHTRLNYFAVQGHLNMTPFVRRHVKTNPFEFSCQYFRLASRLPLPILISPDVAMRGEIRIDHFRKWKDIHEVIEQEIRQFLWSKSTTHLIISK